MTEKGVLRISFVGSLCPWSKAENNLLPANYCGIYLCHHSYFTPATFGGVDDTKFVVMDNDTSKCSRNVLSFSTDTFSAKWRVPIGDSGVLNFFLEMLSAHTLRHTLKIHVLRLIGNACADTGNFTPLKRLKIHSNICRRKPCTSCCIKLPPLYHNSIERYLVTSFRNTRFVQHLHRLW